MKTNEFIVGILNNKATYIEELYKNGKLHIFLPELCSLFTTPEKAEFHRFPTTWLHTKAALNVLESNNEKVILGTLFHDIYKGVSQPYNMNRKDGEKYKPHDSKEALDYFETIANRISLNEDTKKFCMKVIYNHMKIWLGFNSNIKMSTWYKCLKSISYNFDKDHLKDMNLIIEVCTADRLSDHVGISNKDGILLKKLVVESLHLKDSIIYTNELDFEQKYVNILSTEIKPLFNLIKEGKKNELVKHFQI